MDTGLLSRTQPWPELERTRGISGLGIKTMTVAGYVRQSTEEVRSNANGAENQIRNIEAFAQAHGWSVRKMFQDVSEPADNLGRPALLDLLAHPDFDLLVVQSTDRLATKKKDLDFLMALLDKSDVVCVATSWTWDYLSQYMRHCYRAKGCEIYKQLDAEA